MTPHLSSPPSIAAPRWPKRRSISWRAARAACSPCTGSTAHGSVGMGGLGGAQRGLGGSCRPALGVVGAVMGGWSGGGHPGGGGVFAVLGGLLESCISLGVLQYGVGGGRAAGVSQAGTGRLGGFGGVRGRQRVRDVTPLQSSCKGMARTGRTPRGGVRTPPPSHPHTPALWPQDTEAIPKPPPPCAAAPGGGGGLEDTPLFGAIPGEQTYMNEQGETSWAWGN